MINEKDKAKILQGISRDECVELTKQLCDIPSPTGSEREIGEFFSTGIRAMGSNRFGRRSIPTVSTLLV